MPHFYGDLQGNRGMATRQGTRASGIDGHIRGWHVGCRVMVFVDEETGEDTIRVYRTGGSSNSSGTPIAQFTKNGSPQFYK